MDQRERNVDLEEALRASQQGYAASRLWTSMPGIVVSYDPATLTATVQPAIKILQRSASGITSWVAIPALTNVPVQFPGGNGLFVTFSLVSGDEVLLVFGARCKDGWQSLGGVQVQAEFRLHDLSDAVAVPSIFSRPRVPLPGVAPTGTIRVGTYTGSAYIEITQEGVVNVVASGGVNITTSGDVTVLSPEGNVAITAAAGSITLTAPEGINLIGPVNPPL